MHVIDGQAGLRICASLIFCSLTIDNILNIIVLLILAGISISMLSGDNGILQKATQSKELTEKATIIELARTDILGQIAENKGETISETQLKTILNKYFEEFDDELSEDLSETTITLTAKNEYGGYSNIALADIYNGKLAKIQVSSYFYHFMDGGEPGCTIIYAYDENNNHVFKTSQNQPRIISGSGVYIDGYKS